MNAFRVAIALSKARSAAEMKQLVDLLAIARDLDDHEARQLDDILAKRRAMGFPDAAKPRPLSADRSELLSEMKACERQLLFPHLLSLDPSSILEFVENDLVTSIAFWRQLEGPTKEVDSPIIEAINQRRERLLSSIRVFRRGAR